MYVKIIQNDQLKKYHYKYDEVYEVVPYRHNPEQYWEVVDYTLTEEQRNRCTFKDFKNERIFWIFKTHTIKHDPTIENLPEDLFKI